jgi:hypothetical protein
MLGRLAAQAHCLRVLIETLLHGLSLYERGGRQDAAPLLDDGVPALPAQVSVYDGTPARITRWEHEQHTCDERA